MKFGLFRLNSELVFIFYDILVKLHFSDTGYHINFL